MIIEKEFTDEILNILPNYKYSLSFSVESKMNEFSKYNMDVYCKTKNNSNWIKINKFKIPIKYNLMSNL
jgi:hypothetical protein